MVQSDNSSVVNCIRRGGSARSIPLNKMVLWTVQLVEGRSWFLSARHVKGTFNVRADLLSRGVPLPTEWSLDKNSFQYLMSLLPFQPQVDLFASPTNAKLKVFVTPTWMPGAATSNALTVDWNVWGAVYLFPPTPLISQVLALLREYRGEAVLLAPWWPNQAWFPTLLAQATYHFPLPGTTLSQEVLGVIAYAPPCWTSTLHAWVFLN